MKDRKQGRKDVGVHHHICHPCVKQTGSLLDIPYYPPHMSQLLTKAVRGSHDAARLGSRSCALLFFSQYAVPTSGGFWQGPDEIRALGNCFLEHNTYCLGLRLTLHSNLALQRTHIDGKENLSRLASALGPRKRAAIEGIARRKDRIPHKGFSHGDRSVWVWKVRPLQQQDERGSSRVFDVLL